MLLLYSHIFVVNCLFILTEKILQNTALRQHDIRRFLQFLIFWTKSPLRFCLLQPCFYAFFLQIPVFLYLKTKTTRSLFKKRVIFSYIYDIVLGIKFAIWGSNSITLCIRARSVCQIGKIFPCLFPYGQCVFPLHALKYKWSLGSHNFISRQGTILPFEGKLSHQYYPRNRFTETPLI